MIDVTSLERSLHAEHELASAVVSPWRFRGWAAPAILALAAAWLSTGFLFGTPPDEEEFRFAVLSSWLHVRALLDGAYPFWTSALGLGVPQPFVPNFWFHPLLPLLAVLPPATWVRVLLLVHTAIGAIGIWQVCKALEVRPWGRAVCGCTFLLAAPAMNYVLTDAWPSHWVVWTSMPWVLICLWHLLESSEQRWLWSVCLGLISGLVIANANPAYAAVYSVMVPAFVLGRWRQVLEHWRELAVACAIVLAIASPNAALLASERTLFASNLLFRTILDPLPLSSWWDVFLRPLDRGIPWHVATVPDNAHTLFFGGPFAVLALVACLAGGWIRRELVFGLVLAIVFAFTPVGLLSLATQRYQFRDPLVLMAILLAGMTAERWLRSSRTRVLAHVALVAQVILLVVISAPYLARAWDANVPATPWFTGVTAALPNVDGLVSAVEPSSRLLYSPEVDRKVWDRTYLASGLGVNALAYRGINLINSWLKSVSADSISPDERLFYARVRAPQAMVESAASLDLLGVRYLVAQRGERVASDLRERPVRVPTAPELVLYENEDAGNGAFLIDVDVAHASVPLLPNCSHDRLLCRDLSALPHVATGRSSVTRADGVFEIAFEPAERPRTLVVAEMFRPAWSASSGAQRLSTFAFLDSLVAVRIPAGVSSVRLVYRPRVLMALTVAAWAAIAGSVLAGAIALLRTRRGVRPPEYVG